MLLARATAIGPVVTPTSVFIFSLTFPITARATLPHVGIFKTLFPSECTHCNTFGQSWRPKTGSHRLLLSVYNPRGN